MAKGLGKFLEETPGWAKGVIVIAALAGTGLLIYSIRKKIKNEQNLKGAKQEVDSAEATIKTLTTSGQKATLDNLKLNSIANQLQTAFEGYGTDVSSVYRALTSINNDIDMVNLIKVFGIREITSGKLNPAPNFKGTLSQVVTDELNTSEIKALNDLLARKGIKYRF
jgi:hypothetical protein